MRGQGRKSRLISQVRPAARSGEAHPEKILASGSPRRTRNGHREWPVVVKFLLALGAGCPDAEDAAQEAFTEAWRALARPERWALMDDRGRRAWLRQVARRCYQRPPGLRRRQPWTAPAANEDLPEVACHGPGHSDLSLRAVIALDLEYFSSREIAGILDVSEQRVLDLLLRDADTELLAHMRSTTDPVRGLIALMAENDSPMPPISDGSRSAQVAGFLALRVSVNALVPEIGNAIARISFVPFRGDTHDDGELENTLDLARELARTLTHDPNSDPACRLAYSLSRTLDINLARALDLADELGRAHGRVRDYERLRAHSLAAAKDAARCTKLLRNRAHDLAGHLTESSSFSCSVAYQIVQALDLAGEIREDMDLDRVRTLLGALKESRLLAERFRAQLSAVPVDASAVDLSGLKVGDNFRALAGVVWTEETIWPPDLVEHVKASSTRLENGAWRVRNGDARENAAMVTVR